jgi:hypothetical protein
MRWRTLRAEATMTLKALKAKIRKEFPKVRKVRMLAISGTTAHVNVSRVPDGEVLYTGPLGAYWPTVLGLAPNRQAPQPTSTLTLESEEPMSAFIVSRQHIQYLVYALGKYELLEESPEATGQRLWDENIRSVMHRYPDEPVEDLPGPIGETYEYKDVPYTAVLSVAQVVNACRCYSYQSCEHPEWEHSYACALIETLEELAMQGYASAEDIPGYDAAAWEIKEDM